ncbi:MAG: low specificity L-threonine aldolase [Bacteroidales bacterium]|nr:low specificity L-threonine aldolase [Bacteroidales bacterium]
MNAIKDHAFASDNNSGIHPEILAAIARANRGHVIAYGDDPYTRKAEDTLRNTFGREAEPFFVLTGTGANVLGLASLLQPYHAVICAESAHINVDECGAPERFCNCKLLPVNTTDGKLNPDNILQQLQGFGFEHHVQPKVISISQPTEMGTVYTRDEIESISQLAKKHDLYLHVDGARLANAAVRLNLEFKAFTKDAGIDVLSFGGTKNGMLFGESVIFFRKELAEHFRYIRKQGMQLASKMRFIAIQFDTYITQKIWKANASHANEMAQILYKETEQIPEIQVTQKVETNGIFARIPRKIIAPLQKEYFFYVWDEATNEVRWMTSYDTQPEDIEDFTHFIKELIHQ